MAEPIMSTNSPDGGAPRSNAAEDAARPAPAHDRELPVTGSDVDRAANRTTGPANAVESQSAAGARDGTPASTSEDMAGAAEPLTEDQVKLALRRVKDPELNLNILDLGLVYAIRVDGNAVSVDMTLTSPGCPSGPEIMTDAERHLKALPGVGDVAVNLVWSPFWSPERIEPRVRAYLGF
jgi:metal-sulfur cluster biosynthetic enzyme